ncbi:MAG: glycosyltransferase [Ruminococcaceae bacterium]|nr:glycosyltransferase [Oscillospiraceae bacterium]
MQLSLIIPMYNESKIIADTAKQLSAYMQSRFESYEILFSDDGSTDGCGDLVRSLSLPQVRVIGDGTNRGKGYAVRRAMLEAEGELVMFTDADLAYGTDVIGRAYDLYQAKTEKPDLILGSRNLDRNGYDGYSLLRKIMSKLYIRVLCLAGGFRLSDSQCGCKAFRRDAAKDIFGRCEVDGFAFDLEVILWAEHLQYRIEQIPVRVVNHRDSKVHILRDTFRMLSDLRRIRKRIKNVRI